MERIGFTASEEQSFENVDGRTDGCLPIPQAHLSAFGSGELNIRPCVLVDFSPSSFNNKQQLLLINYKLSTIIYSEINGHIELLCCW